MTIPELKSWFASVEQFLDSHFYTLEVNPTSKINEPILDRLLAFKLLIESNL